MRTCQDVSICPSSEQAGTASNSDAGGCVFGRLLNFLNRLDGAHIFYTLGHNRSDSVMVDISLPGGRWEVEFMADGSVDIERYRSVAGAENDPGLLKALFAGIDPV